MSQAFKKQHEIKQMTEKAANINVKFITNWIEDEKRIVILGPDIVFNFQKSMLKELSNYLEENGIESKFDDYEELFSSKTNFDPFFFSELDDFFDNLEASEIYQKIAEIPFHLLISATHVSLETLGLPCHAARGTDINFPTLRA